ncbi:MAG: hypothetical protein RLZZ381_1517 [Cyanobacteriota bacterium]
MRKSQIINILIIAIAFFSSVVVNSLTATDLNFDTSTQRDKWLQPFASNSIWNMPIGSEAVYQPANLQPAGYLSADREYFYRLKADDPQRPVYGPGNFGPGRCTGTESMEISLPIPDDLIVPDATSEPYSTPNNASAFLMPDGKTIEQFQPLARCEPGGNIYGWRNPWGGVSIDGDGIHGTHFGSGLSAIGGSIRLGELTSNRPIPHALKVNIWGEKYLYYSDSVPGHRWPADRTDSYAAERYGGRNPKLVQGTLLAIPPKISQASLKLQTPVGKKLFDAFQNYGAYIVDDAHWDAHYLAVENGVTQEFREQYGYDFEGNNSPFYEDVMQLFQNLYIVDNNEPTNIAGGGRRRVALAPALSMSPKGYALKDMP